MTLGDGGLETKTETEFAKFAHDGPCPAAIGRVRRECGSRFSRFPWLSHRARRLQTAVV
jgi:hypothetical protein